MNMIYYLHGIDKSSFQQFKTDSLFTDNNNRQSLFLIKLKELNTYSFQFLESLKEQLYY